MFASDSLRRALDMVGALLADDGHTVEVVVIGGGALLLDGVIQRPTKDLDASPSSRATATRLLGAVLIVTPPDLADHAIRWAA